ncbi:hypothetical protein [Spiroplasma endosymbiont of Aspidapion aeneum]|uniref:hypothetical protein n=1 Tax=Spiroplasma endosymbiont of Aspidapion aeneum TaxID=3066276 RepID=UPI00313F2AEF
MKNKTNNTIDIIDERTNSTNKKSRLKKNIGIINNKAIESKTINIDDTIGMENYTTDTIKIAKNKKNDESDIIKELNLVNNHKSNKELSTILLICAFVIVLIVILVLFLLIK